MDELWFFEHSVECPVPRAFAWRFWTHVNNWKLDADVESVELDGPFAAGSVGATITHSIGRVEWRIADVQPETGALLEIPFPDGILGFRWTFQELDGGTRMTQRVGISGAPSLVVSEIGHSLEGGIPAGMRKLCAAMTEAADPKPPASS